MHGDSLQCVRSVHSVVESQAATLFREKFKMMIRVDSLRVQLPDLATQS
jgi:hypothetical protein